MTATLISPPSLKKPTIHTLANGLTIIAEQVPIDVVNLNVWLKVGSAVESDEINGMAHFLEHMMFKGTSRLKSGEFEQRIEERGAVTNAATSQEYTHYYLTCAPKDFADLAPLQMDIVCNPEIPDPAFERERLVVLEEIRRSQDNPRRRVFYRAMETCFEVLPYRRPVLGSTPLIEALTPQQMRDFQQTWYQPPAMTAVAVGNLPVDQLIETVSQSFTEIWQDEKESKASFLLNLSPEPDFNQIIRYEEEDDSLQQARLVMMWRVPGLRNLEETYGLDILAVVLGQGKLSRLFRQLREEKRLVSSISASNMTQGAQGVFYISAQLPSEHIKEVEGAICQEIAKIQQESVTENELKRIRTQVANRFIFSNERPSDRANLYGYYHSQLQTLEPALTYPQIIQSLILEEIQKTAQKYLNPLAYAMVTLKPTID
ncbi:MAG: M16 family metallopeptidase [Microcystaceae cyanobacterium]